MDFIWLLAIVSGVLLIVFLVVLVLYIRGRQNTDQEHDDKSDGEPNPRQSKQNEIDFTTCLAELKQQKDIIKQLIVECDPEDKKRMMLFECWALFLDVEYSLVSTQTLEDDIDSALEQFLPLTEDVNFAQSMDGIVKKIAAQKKLSQNMVKEIERKSSVVQAKTESAHQLNQKLEALRTDLSEEDEIDKFLLKVRLELASLWQLENRLKAQLASLEEGSGETKGNYQNAVETFLDNADIEDFITPIHSEYQNKLQQLKAMSDYQKTVIDELKSAVQTAKNNKSNDRSIEYDVALARLEKTFLDKKNILHKLEAKIDSLQIIQHNLTLDVQKQNSLIADKKEELKEQESDTQGRSAMHSILEQQQTSVRAIEDLFDQAPLIQESEQLVEKQSSKIGKIKKMVNESELFVELLEQDLDIEHKKHEELQFRLSEFSEKLLESTAENTVENKEEIETLRKTNNDLETEIRAIEEKLVNQTTQPTEGAIKLQKQLAELDEKIVKMKTDYDQMEEKYLSALL